MRHQEPSLTLNIHFEVLTSNSENRNFCIQSPNFLILDLLESSLDVPNNYSSLSESSRGLGGLCLRVTDSTKCNKITL